MIKTIFILILAAVALAAPSPKSEAEPTNDVLQVEPTDMSSITPEKHHDKRQIISAYSPYQYGYYPLNYGARYPQQYVQQIGGLPQYVQPIQGLSPYRSRFSYILNGLF